MRYLHVGSLCRTLRASRLAVCIMVAISALRAAAPGPGTVFSTMLAGAGQEFTLAVTSDAAGNTYAAGLTYSSDFTVTAGAAQTKFGGTCDAWVAKLGPDGKTVWSTFIGGILDDWATGIAVDGAGNVWVTGYTRSADFPLVIPIQTVYNNGATDDFDAFVAKISPDGSTLLYSSFLGSDLDDGGNGIALDAAGNVLVAVTGTTTRYPGASAFGSGQSGILVTKLDPDGALVWTTFHPGGTASGIALDSSGAIYVAGSESSNSPTPTTMIGAQGTGYAMVFKLSPDGTQKVFETGLGGSASSSAAGLAVNAAGEIIVAGTTTSVDFPLKQPLQKSPGARPLWKTTDGGATWAPFDDLPFAIPQLMIADLSTPQTLYLSTADLGLFKSVDSGDHWNPAQAGIGAVNVGALTIDPTRPQTLYAGAGTTLYKSTDAGGSWIALDKAMANITQIVVDGQNPNVVYEAALNLRKSTDGGATWSNLAFPGTVQSLAGDPHVTGLLFATSNQIFCGFFCSGNQTGSLYRSADGGATWTAIQPWAGGESSFTVDASTNPSTVYLSLTYRSMDGGLTWTQLHPPLSTGVATLDASGALYAPGPDAEFYVSKDHGDTWSPTGTPTARSNANGTGPGISALSALGTPGAVVAELNQVANAGFISKLSADGGNLEFSSYLRAHASTEGFLFYLAEPPAMKGQSWISGIVLDASGNIVVAGGTRGADLPVVNAVQEPAGMAHVFVAKIAGDGSALLYSTYFGGSGDDGGLTVGVDRQGNIIAAGQTRSVDFPLSNPLPPAWGYGDAFVVKLEGTSSAVNAAVNGASYATGGVAPGEDITLFGSGLGPATLTYGAAIGGTLSSNVDGFEVRFDGVAAPIIYASNNQASVMVPYEVAGETTTTIVIAVGGIPTSSLTLPVTASAPGIYTAAQNGLGQGAILNADLSPNSVSNAARAGSAIAVYLTGEGQTLPTGVTGALAPADGSGLNKPVASVTATVGGTAATVLYAGSAPTLVKGIAQVNLQLPQGLGTGTWPVVITYSDAAGRTYPTQTGVTVAVQ